MANLSDIQKLLRACGPCSWFVFDSLGALVAIMPDSQGSSVANAMAHQYAAVIGGKARQADGIEPEVQDRGECFACGKPLD